MRVNKELMAVLVVVMSLFTLVASVCPNNCSGHGTCVNSVCQCYENIGIDKSESYGGNDCSEHTCFKGNPFGAVHSVCPSESGVSYSRSSTTVRELYEYYSNERQADEEVCKSACITLDTPLNGAKSKLWKVKGLEMLVEGLNPSGGILSCKYTKADGTDPESSPNTVDVQSFGDDYQYVLFDGVTSRVDDDISIKVASKDAVVYSKIECDDIISSRDDLSQVNPTAVTVTPAAPRRSLLSDNSTRKLDDIFTLTWNGYGPILKDMGLLTLTEDKTETKYTNDKFRFACYPTDATVDTKTQVTVYDKVEAIYDPPTEDSQKSDVVFTFTGATPPTEDSICLCLMDSNGAIDIDKSEAFNNMREDKTNKGKYLIGKYDAVASGSNSDIKTETVNEKEYPVAVTTTNQANGDLTITFSSSITNYDKYKLYFIEKRVLYATVLTGGIFKEVEAKIGADYSVEVTADADSVIMPYLRISPISELTSSPEPVIVKQTGSTLYKSYYFAEDLLYSLKNEGGILKCKYTPDGKSESETEIDIKGIARNDKVIFFSYFESDESDLIVNNLNCYEVSYIRNDLTLLNPSTFTVKTTTRERQLDTTNVDVMKWDKYGNMFKDLGITSPTHFACLNMNSANKEIKVYDATITLPVDDEITFTITFDSPTESDDGTYLCFLLNTFTNPPTSTLELDKLLTSEMKDRIIVREESKTKKYFYGEYVLGSKTIFTTREEDGSDIIILSSGSKMDLTTKTITISDFDKVKDKISSELAQGKSFYLKMINTKKSFTEEYVKFTVKEDITATDSAITITTTTASDAAYYPYYVIYLSKDIPTDPPTTPPPPPPPTYTLIGDRLYKISNFLSEELLKSFSIIGGKLQCKNNEGTAEVVDLKGIIKKGKTISGGFYEFESKESITAIDSNSCRISSIRKDMSLYKPITYDNKIVTVAGYGTLLSDINYKYGNKKMACYDPSKGVNERIITQYDVIISNVKQSGSDINNLKITFDKTPSTPNICYLLSDVNGNEISIEDSELWSIVRKGSDGKYYFGKSEINSETGKSEEVKQEDGSIKISFSGNAIVTDSAVDTDNGNKINLFQLHDVSSPSFEIPASFIGSESKKMVVAGTTVTFTFTYGSTSYASQSSQILRIESGSNGRFKLLLSDPIKVPLQSRLRFRSLQVQEIPSDLLVDLTWSTEGSTHIALECSGQGSCDRSSGICNCYDGFSGSACQRLDCPNNCNGNGRCVPLSELLSNTDLENYIGFGNKHEGKYKDKNGAVQAVEFDNQVFGCLCDKRHRGYDCSLIECPSGEDPEGATNDKADGEYRDCSGRGICNYNTGICECFDGFSGEGCQNMVQMM